MKHLGSIESTARTKVADDADQTRRQRLATRDYDVVSKIERCRLPPFYHQSTTLWSCFGQNGVSDIAIVIVIPINKVDRHLNLEFSSDFTRGIFIHGWLSFRFSVLGVAGYVMFFRGAPSLYQSPSFPKYGNRWMIWLDKIRPSESTI